MKNFLRLAFESILGAVLLVGCCSASTNLLPQGDNDAMVISTAKKSDCCLSKAKDEAEKFCKEKGKKLVVKDEKTDYQGADKNLKTVVGVTSMLSHNKHKSDGSTDEDYKTTLKITCQ